MPSSDFTPNDVWASAVPSGVEEELTTPSGQTCRAKRVTIESLLEMGILSQADSLTAMMTKYTKSVMKTGPNGGGETVIDESAMMSDPAVLKSIVLLADKAMPIILVSPAVKLHWTERTVGKTTVTKLIPIEDRQSGVVYTDQIGLDDKMWLFDWATGGLKAMAQFRAGPEAGMGSVVDQPTRPVSAKRRSRGN